MPRPMPIWNEDLTRPVCGETKQPLIARCATFEGQGVSPMEAPSEEVFAMARLPEPMLLLNLMGIADA